eukprot:TRINITY_DN19974_c0_g1_i1.p1 TRINITY_DN19974_c0_g1~~TRINITY_DN19974_c0_g1_i1.p1  ORF type:complete len:140 (+),score=29.46 TRINITY_DN19974_c0_g1_i1:215-634(+)
MGCASSDSQNEFVDNFGLQLTADEKEALVDHAWDDFDRDRNGYLDKTECRRVLITFCKARITVLDRKWERFQTRGSQGPGEADAYQEQRGQAAKMLEKFEAGDFEETFRAVDLNKDGKIDKDEFVKLCTDALELKEYWD